MNARLKVAGITTIGAIVIIMAAIIIAAPTAIYLLNTPPVEVEKIVKVPKTLPEIVDDIRSGEIEVGDEYSMDPTARYHEIHAEVLGLNCLSCHTVQNYSEDYLYQRKYVELQPEDPGVIDRGTCLSCHKPGGISRPLYGTIED
jgi:mono/diheme cytochrome c family protein